MDPTNENSQIFWTDIEVLKSLVEANIFPNNYNSIISIIAQSKKSINGFTGWESEGFENYISIYVTGDIIRLYLVLKKFDELEDIIASLQNMQNLDGGWGVCNGDEISKVRSTSWVLSVLISCLSLRPIENMVDQEIVKKGINWLYFAQNDHEDECGWGNLPNTHPSNVSATAFAVDALIDFLKYSKSHKNNTMPDRIASIKRGIQTLKNMNNNGYWQGVREEFGIRVDGNLIGRHIIGGAGTTFVVQVLIKAQEIGLDEWTDYNLYQGIINLVIRCKSYNKLEGFWVIPADDGGPPLSWNSAYAIDAFNRFEKFYASQIIDQWIEKQVYDDLTKTVKFWRHIALIFLFALIGIIVAPFFQSIVNIPFWFASLSVFYQAIIIMFFTIIFEQLYNIFFRVLMPQIRKIMHK